MGLVWLQVHIKGRMPAENAEKFCEELRRSRRRTCSMAIVRSVSLMWIWTWASQNHIKAFSDSTLCTAIQAIPGQIQ